MTKKIIKTILLIVLIVLFMLFIIDCFGITVCDVKRSAMGGTYLVNDYNEFYFYKKEYEPLLSFEFPGAGCGQQFKIWFLPGQKKKMLEKMREDINNDLKKIIADNSDSLKDYEISDDYKKVYVYYFKDANTTDLYSFVDIKIRFRIQLYHQFIDGHGNTEYTGDIINFVEVER